MGIEIEALTMNAVIAHGRRHDRLQERVRGAGDREHDERRPVLPCVDAAAHRGNLAETESRLRFWYGPPMPAAPASPTPDAVAGGPSGEPEPLRSDAARNRRAVLASARDLFRERGLDAGIEEVAERASVGVGTVYRHYPSKAHLVDAVFAESLEELAALAEAALAEEDAWEGFTAFVLRVAERAAANSGLRSVFRRRVRESEALAASWAQAADRIERLVRRAQEQGAMRADVGLADVRAVLWSSAEVAELAAAVAPGLWHRHLHLLLDGLRAEAATPMPAPAVGRSRSRAL